MPNKKELNTYLDICLKTGCKTRLSALYKASKFFKVSIIKLSEIL